MLVAKTSLLQFYPTKITSWHGTGPQMYLTPSLLGNIYIRPRFFQKTGLRLTCRALQTHRIALWRKIWAASLATSFPLLIP